MRNREVKIILGDNIRTARTKKRLTQEKLSGLSKIAQNQISEIENAVSNPSVNTLIKLADALDIDLKDLFRA